MSMIEVSEDTLKAYTWKLFTEAVGLEKVRRMYGQYWPRPPVPQERLWQAWGPQDLIGWISLRPDPVDPVVWMAMGIWPNHQGVGHSNPLFKWSLKKTFELFPDTAAMFYAVSKNNEGLLKYIIEGERVERVGETTFPEPGFVYFAIKNRGRNYGRETNSTVRP